MKVLHLLSSGGFHGSEAMVAQLSAIQNRNGQSSEVAVFETQPEVLSELSARFGAAGIPLHILPTHGRLDLGLVWRLRRLVREKRFDLIHSHKYKTNFYAIAALLGTRVPIVATYHNWLLGDRFLRAYAMLDKALARFCDANVGVSNSVYAELKAYGRKCHVYRVPNGVDLVHWSQLPSRQTARQCLGLAATENQIVAFIGRLSAEKGIDTLIDAFRQLQGTLDCDCELVIAGDGPELEPLRAKVAQRGLTSRVRFVGVLADPRYLYAAADVLALPSRVEAFPMVILEAMAGGCPVVATSVGDVAELVRNGQTGLLLPPDDCNALAEALTAILTDSRLAQSLATQAASLVRSNFSAEHMADAYMRIYAGARDRRLGNTVDRSS